MVGYIVHPIDVIRKHIILKTYHSQESQSVSTTISTFRHIIKTEGIKGFTKNITAQTFRSFHHPLPLLLYSEIKNQFNYNH